MKKGFKSLEEQQLKQRLAKVCRLLFRMGLVAHAEGNVSCRIGQSQFFIKKSGCTFRAMKPENFVLIDEKGISLTSGEPSTEKLLHLEIYKHMPEANFVIHTHPPNVIRVSSTQIDTLRLPRESHAFPITGDIPIIGPFKAGTHKLALEAAKALKKKNARAVVLRGHGLSVVCPTLEEAFDLTVFIEKVALLK
ncbi:class II aldolase/adducin family protein [Candidatus Bathyarchaeota archaeon]|nr:class II aldolase/adducin family protein [Candidatus Bathyarchaeota archaeon]